MHVLIVGEIGINHNGDIEIAKKLIDGAARCGADAVKFQKRTVGKVYTKEALDSPRESPWGTTTRQQKQGLEFGLEEYKIIDAHCQKAGIEWFASAWDLESQNFLGQFNLKHNKVASVQLTNLPLLEMIAEEGRYTFISTGMSTMEEIERAVDLFRAKNCPFELMHCNSTYPMPVEQANLKMIETLRNRFNCKVGYSGHEVGIAVSAAAVALGATSLERHITASRAMYGSDQAASVELVGLEKLVRYVRAIEKALGDGVKRITDSEWKVREKLKPTPAAMGLTN